MRAKKILPFVLLAFGALFLLSSCDAILDALYANNTINVTAYVSVATHPGATSPYSTVTVALGGASGGTASAGWSGSYNSNGYAIYYLPSMPKLPNGNYTITSTFYNGYLESTIATSTFYDQNGIPYMSAPLPFNGANTVNFSVYFF